MAGLRQSESQNLLTNLSHDICLVIACSVPITSILQPFPSAHNSLRTFYNPSSILILSPFPPFENLNPLSCSSSILVKNEDHRHCHSCHPGIHICFHVDAGLVVHPICPNITASGVRSGWPDGGTVQEDQRSRQEETR